MSHYGKADGLLAMTGLEAVQQQFEKMSFNILDPQQVNFSIDATQSLLVIQSRDILPTGAAGRFSGTRRLSYSKAALEDCVAFPIHYRGPYPVNYRDFRAQLLLDYGIVLEERDLALSHLPDHPLLDGQYLDAPVDVSTGALSFVVTPASGRFLAGGRFHVIVTAPYGRRRLVDTFHQIYAPDVATLGSSQHSTGPTTLFNASDESIAQELVKRHVGLAIDRETIEVFVQPMGHQQSKLILYPRQDNDRHWSGSAEFVFNKADVAQQLPEHLTVNTPYPSTFFSLQRFLQTTYGFELRAGEFSIGRLDGPILGTQPEISTPLSPQGYLDLFARDDCVRWAGRSRLRLQFHTASGYQQGPVILNPMPVQTPQDVFRYTYAVDRAEGDCHFRVIKGNAPAPLRADGVYEGALVPGTYIWTVSVTDARNRPVLYTEAITVTALT